MKFITGFFAVVLLSLISSAQDMRPFSLDWRAESASPADMSRLLDAPAGRDGFVRIENGHLVKPSGERLRIWGMNFSSNACFPAKEDAPALARYLARMGINCVRFHHMDNPGTRFLNGHPGDTRTLDPDKLDRLDFFIAELKKRGVYGNINLNVARQFQAGDGVRDADLLGYAKGITYFDERIVELQKEFARQLLTHHNPYTQSEYRNEPAVVIVEMVNENSLVESWISAHLLGLNTTKHPGTWADIPASYGQALTEKYNAWLKDRLSSEDLASVRSEAGVAEEGLVPRLAPDEFEESSSLRFRSEASFYMELEKTFFDEMRRYLKEELGVKALLVGSSDHNHYRSGYPHLASMSGMDIIDGHVYWQHPETVQSSTGGRRDFSIDNTPMVNDPAFSTIAQLSRSAFAGKPYTVSEINQPYPNEYACELAPLLGAYAALQDWDGIFFYTFEHQEPSQWKDFVRGHFDFRPDPVKMAGVAAGSMLFLRGDVQPARETVTRSYSREQVIDSLRLPHSERPFFTPGFDTRIPLRHATRIKTLESSEPGGNMFPEMPNVIASDTEELEWSVETKDKGFVRIDTPRSQALVGFVKENRPSAANLSAEVENSFCAVQCSSLDGRPIARSRQLLLTATARAWNSGTVWNEERTSLKEWGTEPVLIEPVKGTVMLSGMENAKRVTVTPLDGAGQSLTEAKECRQEDGKWILPVGESVTVWYLIAVE